MKFAVLLKGELQASLKHLPLLLLFLFLCLSAVAAALPVERLQRGAEITDLKIGISVPNDQDVLTEIMPILQLDQRIEAVKLVEPATARKQLQAGQLDLYLELPDNLAAALFEREPAIINLRSSDPLLGAAAYQIITAAVAALNRMQSASLSYYEALTTAELPRKERSALSQAFDLQLIQLVFTRGRYVQTEASLPQYALQLVALLLFLSSSTVVCYYSLMLTQQLNQQVFRKLRLYRYPFWQIWLSKLTVCWLWSLPSCLLVFWFSNRLELAPRLLPLIAGELILTSCLFALTSGITTWLGRARTSNSVLLVNFSLLLLLVFAGGLIYPTYSQPLRFTTGNPAWLTQLFAEAALTAKSLNPLTYLPYMAITCVCGWLTLRTWRKQL